jgi:hypothetical protein
VPERSVVGRVAESLPPPPPQLLSQRTRPSTSPARNHALPARRLRMRGATRRSLVAGATRRVIQDVRIDDHLRSSQGRRGEHARYATPAILRPQVRSQHHPKRVRTPVPHRARLHSAAARGRQRRPGAVA